MTDCFEQTVVIRDVGPPGRSATQVAISAGWIPAGSTDDDFLAFLASRGEEAAGRVSLLRFDLALLSGATDLLDTALAAWRATGGGVDVWLPLGNWRCAQKHKFDGAAGFAGGIIYAHPEATVTFEARPASPLTVDHHGLSFVNCVGDGVVGGRWRFGDLGMVPGATTTEWAVIRQENCTDPVCRPDLISDSPGFGFFGFNCVGMDWGGVIARCCNAYQDEFCDDARKVVDWLILDSENRLWGEIPALNMHLFHVGQATNVDYRVRIVGGGGKARPGVSPFMVPFVGVNPRGCRFDVRIMGVENDEADSDDWLAILTVSLVSFANCHLDCHVTGEANLYVELINDLGGNTADIWCDGLYKQNTNVVGQGVSIKGGGREFPPNQFARVAAEGIRSVVRSCVMIRAPGDAIRLRRSSWEFESPPVVIAPASNALIINDTGRTNAVYGTDYPHVPPHDEVLNIIADRPAMGIGILNGSNISFGPLTRIRGAGWGGTNSSTRAGLHHAGSRLEPGSNARVIDRVRVLGGEYSDPVGFRTRPRAVSVAAGPAEERMTRCVLGSTQKRLSLMQPDALHLGERGLVRGALVGGHDALIQSIDREYEEVTVVYEALQALPGRVRYAFNPSRLVVEDSDFDLRDWITPGTTKLYSPFGCWAYVGSFSSDGLAAYLVDDGPQQATFGEAYVGAAWRVLDPAPGWAASHMTRLSGTVSVSAAGTVTGTGTNFLNQVHGPAMVRLTRGALTDVDGNWLTDVSGEPLVNVSGFTRWRRVGTVESATRIRLLNVGGPSMPAGTVMEISQADLEVWGATRVGVKTDSALIASCQVKDVLDYGGWGGRSEVGQLRLTRAITTLARAGGVVTAHLATSLNKTGAAAGDSIQITAMPNLDPKGFEGTFTLASVSADGQTVTWAQAGPNTTATSGLFLIPGRSDFTRLIDENSFQMEASARFTAASGADAFARLPAQLQLRGASARVQTGLTGADSVKLEAQAQGTGSVIGSVLCQPGALRGDGDTGGFSQGGPMGQEWRLRATALSGPSPVAVTGEVRVALDVRMNRPLIPEMRPL